MNLEAQADVNPQIRDHPRVIRAYGIVERVANSTTFRHPSPGSKEVWAFIIWGNSNNDIRKHV